MRDDSAARRLYDLLDTLVVMRLDFGTNAEGKAAAFVLGPEKIQAVRDMLDQAIAFDEDHHRHAGAATRSRPLAMKIVTADSR